MHISEERYTARMLGELPPDVRRALDIERRRVYRIAVGALVASIVAIGMVAGLYCSKSGSVVIDPLSITVACLSALVMVLIAGQLYSTLSRRDIETLTRDYERHVYSEVSQVRQEIADAKKSSSSSTYAQLAKIYDRTGNGAESLKFAAVAIHEATKNGVSLDSDTIAPAVLVLHWFAFTGSEAVAELSHLDRHIVGNVLSRISINDDAHPMLAEVIQRICAIVESSTAETVQA